MNNHQGCTSTIGLLNTRSVRIEPPVTRFDPKPVVDLNPQDPVLHKIVSDCSGRFRGNGGRAGGTSPLSTSGAARELLEAP
jgi:hypothetical protein